MPISLHFRSFVIFLIGKKVGNQQNAYKHLLVLKLMTETNYSLFPEVVKERENINCLPPHVVVLVSLPKNGEGTHLWLECNNPYLPLTASSTSRCKTADCSLYRELLCEIN